MTRLLPLALAILLVNIPATTCRAQLDPETVQRIKRATALVEVSSDKVGATGSGFCVDQSGLFITNAHVVQVPARAKPAIHLVLDIGLDTQRTLEATLLRHDDRMDLALLQVDPKDGAGLISLELGSETTLKELAQVVTFGYPFGRSTAVGRAQYPDITVLSSRITSLQRNKGELREIQFDNQLNPGNSGGPVCDASGKVVGVAVATVRAASLNMAISVNTLADFLTAPGLSFDPAAVAFADVEKPVSWKIGVQPPRPGAKLVEGLSVAVTVPDESGKPCAFPAQPAGEGVYEAKVIPTPRAPLRPVDIVVKTEHSEHYVEVRLRDDDVMAGGSRYISAALRTLFGGPTLPRQAVRGRIKSMPGLPVRGMPEQPRTIGTMDLTQTNFIKVVPINWPYHRALLAEVNATLGSKVVATVRHRVEVTGPFSVARPGANVIVSLPREMPGPTAIKGPPDQGLIELGGVLDIDGIPAGAGKSIQPPRIAVPKAKLSTDNDAQPESPLIKKLDGSLSEVAMGGGGRYLLLTSSSSRKLFVFDANAAEIVKTISLPSPNVIVAAGASKFLIAFPEQKLIQRWDFPTLRREGSSRALPIKGPLKALVLGSDSNGPALAFWTLKQDTYSDQTVFSFIDIGSLKVLSAGMVASWGTWGYVSTSGGTFSLQEFSNNPGLKSEPLHIRAAAGGALYTFWNTSSVPTGFHTLIAQGKVLKAIYRHESPGHLIAGPDGRTVFSGRAGRLDVDGNALDHKEARTDALPEPSIPSCDPSFYLKIHGLVWTDPAGRRAATAESGGVRASVHDSQSGTPLLTVVGLSEMTDVVPEDRRPDYTRVITDFTLDKRFFLIPSARLLITIPASNDRLCLRRSPVT